MKKEEINVALPVILLMNPHGPLAGDDIRTYVELARIAEDAGLFGVQAPDHVIMSDKTAQYPYGEFPVAIDDPMPEPLTLLASIASVTSRIRLATSILIAPLRPAALIAKTVATVDCLSQGRVDLGVGVGWQPEEYVVAGLDYSKRQELLDKAIRTCRILWRPEATRIESPVGIVDRVVCSPRPVQARIPVLFGVNPSKRNASRIAELGDGWWAPPGLLPQQVSSGVETLREAFTSAGRDPARLIVRVALRPTIDSDLRLDAGTSFANVPEFESAGATLVSFNLPRAVTNLDAAKRLIYDLAGAQGGG